MNSRFVLFCVFGVFSLVYVELSVPVQVIACKDSSPKWPVSTSGISDVCLECGVAPHSVEHLSNCQSHPTQLTVQDLWDNLAAVRLPQPGQLMIGDDLLGYHNNNNNL